MPRQEYNPNYKSGKVREIMFNGIKFIVVKMVSGLFSLRRGHIDGPQSGDYEHIRDIRKWINPQKK